MDKINIDDLTADFGEGNKLRDDYLIELLGKSYKGDIMCRMANIKMAAIVPFIEINDPVSEDFKKYFLKKVEDGKHISILVYQKGDRFIMSDDYNSYAMYKELGFDVVPCYIVGEITDVTNIVNMGESFKMDPPGVEVIN